MMIRNTLTKDDKRDVVRRYLDGETGPVIGKAFGVGHATIYRVLKAAGVLGQRGVTPVPDVRVCNKCRVEKPITAFASISTRTGPKSRMYECRQCIATRYRERGYSLKGNTGLSLDDYNALFAAQNGVCAICGEPPKRYRFSIDHDHDTNIVRGLLCQRCNRYMAALDDIEWLAKATTYRATARTPYTFKTK